MKLAHTETGTSTNSNTALYFSSDQIFSYSRKKYIVACPQAEKLLDRAIYTVYISSTFERDKIFTKESKMQKGKGTQINNRNNGVIKYKQNIGQFNKSKQIKTAASAGEVSKNGGRQNFKFELI